MSNPLVTRGSEIVILSNDVGETLAQEVVKHLSNGEHFDVRFVKMDIKKFPDGELHASITESIRGADAFFIAPFYPEPNERWTEAIIALSTIKYSTPFRVTHVPTYLGFARKDWKDEPRCPLTIREVATSTEPYINRMLAMDMHSPQIQGMYRVPVDHLKALPIFLDYFKIVEEKYGYISEDVVFLSPDLGNAKQTRKYSELAQGGFAVVDKERIGPSQTIAKDIHGDSVRGKVVRMVDDMVSTGGSVIAAARYLKEQGFEPKRVEVYATHGLFVASSCPAEEKFRSAVKEGIIDQLYVTDTIPRSQEYVEQHKEWLTYVSISKFLAQAIASIHRDESISKLFPKGVPI